MLALIGVERVPLTLAAAIVGWLAGWGSAWVTARLEPEHTAHGRIGLARDPLVQSVCAFLGVVAGLSIPGDWWRPLEATLLGVPMIQVAVTDYRTRYVYNYYAAMGLVLGLALGWHFHAAAWWSAPAGAVGGLITFGLLYVVGRLIYRGETEAMARGDITIAAMVGAIAAACTAQALFWGVLFGGVLAIGMLIVRRSRYATMPYGPGLCLGGLATLFFC